MFKKSLFCLFCIFFIECAAAVVTSESIDSRPCCKVIIGVDIPSYVGIQGQYHLLDRYYVKMSMGFAPEILIQFQHDFMPSGFSNEKDSYRSHIMRMMNDSIILDGRFGWSPNLQEGPYVELGWRMMAWGHSINLQTDDLQKFFSYSVNKTKNNTLDFAKAIYPTEIVFNYGPILYVGYSTILSHQFFFNMEFNIYKPIFSLINVSEIVSNQVPPKKIVHRVHHTIRSSMWMMSVGLWLGFLF